MAVVTCYAGPVEEGERVVRPLKQFGSPVLDLCQPKPYLAHQQMFDPSFRHGWWYYVRSCDIGELTDDVIDIVVEYGLRIASPITSVALCRWAEPLPVCRSFLMEEGEDRVRQAYGAETYDRLKALKRKYDPTNFFRLNQNIKPDPHWML